MSRAGQARGASGEARVARWYRDRGYEVLERNWRVRAGEIDLVLARPGELVFCEVKARSSSAYGVPAEAVTPAKQRRIRGLAVRWLRESGRHADRVRFDVAAVLGTAVEVIEDAF